MSSEERVGVVTGYYARIGVAAVRLSGGALHVGDYVRFRGHTTDFTQAVESLEVEHTPVQQAEPGAEVALKVSERVRRHDGVFRVVV